MGYRVVIPGNKPEIEIVMDHAFSHPLKVFEIENKGILKSIGYHASDLINAGVLDIVYNRRTQRSSIVAKTNNYRKIKGRGKNIEYIVGDKINNVLKIDAPLTKKPSVLL